MKFITENWIIILILIILIFLVYKYWKKESLKTGPSMLNNQPSVLVNNLGNSVKSNTGSVNTVQVVTTQVPVTVNAPSLKIGNKIYAGSTGVNTYSAPSAGTFNLIKHYNANEYIGDFLANENGYVKMAVSEKNTNVLTQAFGINYNDNNVRYSIATQIYTK